MAARADNPNAAGPLRRPGAGVSREELRRIVSKRGAAPTPPPHRHDPAQATILYRRDLPRREHLPSPSGIRERASGGVNLEDTVAGEERTATRGRLFVVRSRIDEPALAGLNPTFTRKLADETSGMNQRLSGLIEPLPVPARDVVFLDVESTGLGSSQVFLVGIMVWDEGGLEVRQFLARDYAEEAAVLETFLETCATRRLLVTFNGKSFDVPFLRARCAANGLRCALELAHLDLLHVCRRIWKSALPDCRLQTLEQHICRRARYGDIPGQDIPDAYHAFVRTRDAYEMVKIITHNRMDLVTLAELMTRFPAPEPGPDDPHGR